MLKVNLEGRGVCTDEVNLEDEQGDRASARTRLTLRTNKATARLHGRG
jgi:hypothetical protein